VTEADGKYIYKQHFWRSIAEFSRLNKVHKQHAHIETAPK